MKSQNSIWKALTMVTQIGISMMTPIFLCAFIGYYIDKWLSTGICFLLFIIIGIIVAFRNVYYLTKGFYEKEMKEEHKKLEYWKNLKETKYNKKDHKKK